MQLHKIRFGWVAATITTLILFVSRPFHLASARGGVGPMSMMRQLERSQRQPRQQQKKRTESVKPTFLRTESGREGDGGVDHVVLLKINVSETTKVGVRTLRKGAQKLATIDGVESVTVGDVLPVDLSAGEENRTEGYNFYIRVRVASIDKLRSFASDPLHKDFYSKIDPILKAKPLVIDSAAAAMSASKLQTAIDTDRTTLPQPQLLQQRGGGANNHNEERRHNNNNNDSPRRMFW
eukprot:CAMPEP_0197185988 /NCGR_PEP_ID=MMETSP1423-20130617/12999_1 /TAXON_ID=476441 /ORGANISM="Pseudo-nitzschia heimii, Strain UNC1101" /LENGTH=236 /DNA_ID=CAMNT_0042637185 /DNA_START=21 /DNA_END=728 /DNA_ORIENTATION=+